jgi:hypothetical protein
MKGDKRDRLRQSRGKGRKAMMTIKLTTTTIIIITPCSF